MDKQNYSFVQISKERNNFTIKSYNKKENLTLMPIVKLTMKLLAKRPSLMKSY